MQWWASRHPVVESQQEPQWPWSLMGVTTPFVRQSTAGGRGPVALTLPLLVWVALQFCGGPGMLVNELLGSGQQTARPQTRQTRFRSGKSLVVDAHAACVFFVYPEPLPCSSAVVILLWACAALEVRGRGPGRRRRRPGAAQLARMGNQRWDRKCLVGLGQVGPGE